jgi:hypothetical protein
LEYEEAVNETPKAEDPTLYTPTIAGKHMLGSMPSNYTKRICTALNDKILTKNKTFQFSLSCLSYKVTLRMSNLKEGWIDQR